MHNNCKDRLDLEVKPFLRSALSSETEKSGGRRVRSEKAEVANGMHFQSRSEGLLF